MSWNSLGSFNSASIDQLRDAAGITQFPDATSWYQVLNGLQIQGGYTPVVTSGVDTTIPFQAPYKTQLLGVFLTPIDYPNASPAVITATTDLIQFTFKHSGTDTNFYWWAIGV